MGATEQLSRLQAQGFRLDVDGDMLVVKPAVRLADAVRTEIRANKPELIRALQRRTASPSLSETLRATITRACTARDDDDANRVALIDECLALPPDMQQDIRQHFVQVARIWGRFN